MEVTYTLVYHEDVVKKDIPQLSANAKLRIKNAIEQRLITAPETFGKPLRRSLHGLRSLRVGDYRVVFRIEITKQQVTILFIGHRSTIYTLAKQAKRDT